MTAPQLRIPDEVVARIRHYRAALKGNPRSNFTLEMQDFVQEFAYVGDKQYRDHYNELSSEDPLCNTSLPA